MKIGKLLLSFAVACSLNCVAQQIDPLTKALFNGYEELLQENPKDYHTLYERAALYYNLSQYDNALNDLIKAIDYTPEKEADTAKQEFSLLADITIALKDYDKALWAIEKSLSIDPSNYADIYKKGNILLYLNQPQEAYKTFSSLQRLRSRSQEAYFGMAKASIIQGNQQEAENLMKEAEQADPTNYITYCRIGDLYHDMKRNDLAATNYLMAFSLSRSSQRPLQSLIDLSIEDYPSTASALDYAATKTNNKAPIYLIRGNVALSSGHYTDARAALKSLLTLDGGREPFVYAMMAENDIALGDYIEAIKNINTALQSDEKSQYLTLKAKALRANGQAAQGLLEAKRAVELDHADGEALLELARCAVEVGDAQTALDILNEVIMSDPENLEPLMLRAFVYEKLLNNSKQAVNDYVRASNIETDFFPNIAYRALAKSKAGKQLDADAIMEEALKTALDKDASYAAALYYSQTGNLEKAMEWMTKALTAGYENQYNLKGNKFANLNISPIRHLLK
ncbi:MAG: tetratricopeptide repeat protein [Clostridium sp.]|nr:tetratricopeptide repeat protein [Prevotella sp.]MCM1428250.1 tetratricopeptide repeat protein [Clostridium sp.]